MYQIDSEHLDEGIDLSSSRFVILLKELHQITFQLCSDIHYVRKKIMQEWADTIDNNLFNAELENCLALKWLKTIVNSLYEKNKHLTVKFMTLTINPLNEDVLLLMRELISTVYLF